MSPKLSFLISLIVGALVHGGPPATQAQSPPPEWAVRRSADLTLTLECLDSRNIRFAISNIGTTDTALVLGLSVGNGRKYIIATLDLSVTTPAGKNTEYQYSPRNYPPAIGGRLDDWIQPLPVTAVYAMSATHGDFLHGLERLPAFPRNAELSLRWTIRNPKPDAMLLASWSGTLTSNTCRTR
jgi:hypothetical protein